MKEAAEGIPKAPASVNDAAAARFAQGQELLDNIHARIEDLEELLDHCGTRWAAEDLIYRFWHQSFKALGLQELTKRIVAELEAIKPRGTQFDPWFHDIIAAGTGLTFDMSMNKDWPERVRPVVDAYFHAKFMLEMTVRYGRELDTAPHLLPPGWATLLELYGIR